MANFAALRTKYYKHQSALNVLDHAHSKRNGYTKSDNVIDELSHENVGTYAHGAKSSFEAYQKVREAHTKRKGKKPRSDMNTMFEHVVILSVGQYEELERQFGKDEAKAKVMRQLVEYAKRIKAEYGFEPLGIDLHLDEGTEQEDGSIKRNIHAHVAMYNYDFKNDVAPLRKLMVKGKQANGKSNDLNPNFVKMQDIVAAEFEPLGFRRGISQGVDNVKHKAKAQWIQAEQARLEGEIQLTRGELDELKNKLVAAGQRHRKAIVEAQDEVDRYKTTYVQPVIDSVQQFLYATQQNQPEAYKRLRAHIDSLAEKNPDMALSDEQERILDDALRPFQP